RPERHSVVMVMVGVRHEQPFVTHEPRRLAVAHPLCGAGVPEAEGAEPGQGIVHDDERGCGQPTRRKTSWAPVIPLSSWVPSDSNRRSVPAESCIVVPLTTTSPAPASAITRAAM